MQDSNDLPLGFGSGFFVKSNLIATNYHVIAGAASGTAKLVGKSTTYKIEGFTATNKYNDLAILKVSASGIKPLPLGNSDAVKIGETVYVAGNPKGSGSDCYLEFNKERQRWEFFYDGIRGFDFEPGFIWTLKVSLHEYSGDIQDVGLYEYRLIEVLSKEEASINERPPRIP